MKKIRMKTLLLSLGLGSFLTIVGLIYFYIWAPDPLQSRGHTEMFGERKKIYIELTNHGRTNVQLTDVTINKGEVPDQVDLVMSYTGQIVSNGIEKNLSSFVPIDSDYIYPNLPGSEVRKLLDNKNPDLVPPIHYGLHIMHHENVDTIEITYRYFGFPKKLIKKISD